MAEEKKDSSVVDAIFNDPEYEFDPIRHFEEIVSYKIDGVPVGDIMKSKTGRNHLRTVMADASVTTEMYEAAALAIEMHRRKQTAMRRRFLTKKRKLEKSPEEGVDEAEEADSESDVAMDQDPPTPPPPVKRKRVVTKKARKPKKQKFDQC